MKRKQQNGASDMIIRSFCEADAEKVSALIIHTLQASNSKDYSAETISALEKKMQPSGVLERRRAACSISLFCPNIREKASAEKSSKRLNRMDFSSEQSASRFPHRSQGWDFTESLAMNTKTALTVPMRSGCTDWKRIEKH